MKKTIYTLIILVILLSLLSSCSDSNSENMDLYSKGIAAYEKGDFELAKGYFDKLSDFEDSQIYLKSIMDKQQQSKEDLEISNPLETNESNVSTTEKEFEFTFHNIGENTSFAKLQLTAVDPNTMKPPKKTTQIIEVDRITADSGLFIDPFIIEKDGNVLTAEFYLFNPNSEDSTAKITIELFDENDNLVSKEITSRLTISAGVEHTFKYGVVIDSLTTNIQKVNISIGE